MTGDVMYCPDLDRSIELFMRLGFRLDTIFPADDPSVACLSGHATQVRLVRSGVRDDLELDVVPALRPAFSVVTGDDASWRTGRAGMQYRDLIPDRQGGRYIASHIRIINGGPVPDYVHFHAIQFQMIYCHKGWVRVVYEDQGAPFVMLPGACVLQPPGIRHRVLEASPGLEVIEVSTPAVHATHVDHELALPSPGIDLGREREGQRFVHFQPASARFAPSAMPGFERCDLGIADATRGRATVSVLRARSAPDASDATARDEQTYVHGAELWFHVILRGGLTLDRAHRLGPTAAFTVPAGRKVVWSDATPDLELLEVTLPGDAPLEHVLAHEPR